MTSETALPPESPLRPDLPTVMLENQWRLTEFTYNNARRDFSSIRPILVTFQPGIISVQACNSVSFLMDRADVSTENSYLLTQGDGTARECDDGGTEQEGIFGQALLATSQYEIVDDMLILKGKHARLVLVIDNEAEKSADHTMSNGVDSILQKQIAAILITSAMDTSEDGLPAELASQAKALNIERISVGEVDAALSKIEAAMIIYMMPGTLREIEPSQLSAWYRENKLLVGLNVQSSEMAELIGIPKTRDDLDLAFLPEGYIFASHYQMHRATEVYAGGKFTKSTYYSDFTFLHIENTLWLDNLYSDEGK